MKFKVKYLQLNDIGWLKTKYEIEQLSCKEIAQEIGCSKDAVRIALIRCNIELRQSKETNKLLLKRKPKFSKYPLLNDESWIRQKHLVEKVSIGVLVKLSGAKQVNSVLQAFKKFDIEAIPHESCLVFLPNVKALPLDNNLKINIDVINGCLLGDAWLETHNKKSDNSNPSFNKRNKFHDHVSLINSLLFEDSKKIIEEWHCINDKKLRYWKISSFCDKRLLLIFRKWYPEWNNYKKVIPDDIEINNILLLHWFLDDGSSSYRNRNYEKLGWIQRKKQIILTFCTECFEKENQQMLCDKINEKFPLNARLATTNSGTGWRIKIPQSKVEQFYEIVGPPPIQSLAYKWKQL